MTDRELLELAAKAAGGTNGESNGLFYQWHDLPHTGVDRVLRYVGQREWNPLTDDGDALRLAVKLGLSVVHRHDFTSDEPKAVAAAKWPGDYDDTETYYGGDPYAATRRAIVLAAAEVGKTQ